MKHFRILSFLLFTLLLCVSCDPQENTPTVEPGIVLSDTIITIQPGESYTLTATVTPATNNTTLWSTGDSKIATVFYGKVSGINQGSTTITVTNGTLTATCTVNVELRPYQLVWSEEFEGTELNTDNWNIETGGNGWGNQEKQYYTGRSENLRVANGKLYIEALKENYESNSYTSARINTKNKQSFAYGRIEANLKLPSGQGTWPAFWMLGYGSWPTCGEIDIMEHVGSKPTMISHAVHTGLRNGNNGSNWYAQNTLNNAEGEFHTYAIEWEENISNGDDYIKFYVDDTLTATLWQAHGIDDKSAWPFNSEFFIILNMAIGGNMGGTIDDTIFNEDIIMEVDWVRVYQRL